MIAFMEVVPMLTNKRLCQPGIDFAGNFEKDNFASRRTTGNNMYDPESLITGAELAAGLTYKNSGQAMVSPKSCARRAFFFIPGLRIV